MRKIYLLILLIIATSIIGCSGGVGDINYGIGTKSSFVLDYDGVLPITLDGDYGSVTIEKLSYEVKMSYFKYFKIYLSGICGPNKSGKPDASRMRVIKYKLIDPDGYVVNSDNIYIDDMSPGEKFKIETTVGFDQLKTKGKYKLQLLGRFD